MSLFNLTGGNFVEVVQPALESHILYILLFMSISLAALFFVSAALIEIFMKSYEKVLPYPPGFISKSTNITIRLWFVRLTKASFVHRTAAADGQDSLQHSLLGQSLTTDAHNASRLESFKSTLQKQTMTLQV